MVKNLRQKRYKTFASEGIAGEKLGDIRGLYYLLVKVAPRPTQILVTTRVPASYHKDGKNSNMSGKPDGSLGNFTWRSHGIWKFISGYSFLSG